MKILLFFGIFLFSAVNMEAQQPILSIDFEGQKKINTRQGILGKAFDLGPLSSTRYALAVDNPMNAVKNFSVTVWVKAPENSYDEYVILSSLRKAKENYFGWKIAVQSNGAWKFEIKTENAEYEYVTMPFRQNIRDGRWHLLGVTYDAPKNELHFYFDGKLMAIYNAPGLDNFNAGEKLLIGNSLDSKHERVTGEFTKSYLVQTEWDSFLGWIDDVNFYTKVLSAEEISSYFHRVTGTAKVGTFDSMANVIKVTSFNIWHGGNRLGQEAGKHRLIKMLERTGSDVYLLVETYGSGEEIADALGYYLYLISPNLSIISRYPFTKTYKIFKPFNSGGAQIKLPGGKKMNLFCLWLSSRPQYYIKGLTSEEPWPLEKFMKVENKTRGAEMRAILDEIDPHIKNADEFPLVVGGDFNSGSHLDWSDRTAFLHNGYTVPWPASIAAESAGLIDSFREIHPDPIKIPGITWSPIREFPLKDRIDYIYYKGKFIQPVESQVLDEHPVVFPSDHAGISTLFQLKW